MTSARDTTVPAGAQAHAPHPAETAPPDFEALYQRSFPELMRHVTRTLTHGDPADAADIAQEALIRAWAAWPTFTYRGDAALTGWLRRIALNLYRDRHRSQRSQRGKAGLSFTGLAPDTDGWALPTTDPLDDPEGHLLHAERYDEILSHLAVLTDAERAAFTAVDVDGCNLGDAARRLGTSPGACKTALWRARNVIARRLGGDRRVRWLTSERRAVILSYRGEYPLAYVAYLVGASRRTVLSVWAAADQSSPDHAPAKRSRKSPKEPR